MCQEFRDLLRFLPPRSHPEARRYAMNRETRDRPFRIPLRVALGALLLASGGLGRRGQADRSRGGSVARSHRTRRWPWQRQRQFLGVISYSLRAAAFASVFSACDCNEVVVHVPPNCMGPGLCLTLAIADAENDGRRNESSRHFFPTKQQAFISRTLAIIVIRTRSMLTSSLEYKHLDNNIICAPN